MKKILCFTLAVMVLLLGVISVSANDDSTKVSSYEEEIIEKLSIANLDYTYYKYEELYRCFAEDVTVPEYVLVFFNSGEFSPAYSCGVFGDYVVRELNVYNPYELGYYVYLPAEGAVYTLREAWCADIVDISKAFTEGVIGELIGDVDNDNKLSVKDATTIQKSLAGIEQDYETKDSVMGIYDDETVVVKYISDFNLDGDRNIKDATAIQKHIAGLSY